MAVPVISFSLISLRTTSRLQYWSNKHPTPKRIHSQVTSSQHRHDKHDIAANMERTFPSPRSVSRSRKNALRRQNSSTAALQGRAIIHCSNDGSSDPGDDCCLPMQCCWKSREVRERSYHGCQMTNV